MNELEQEVFAAQRRLLIKFLDWYYTGEDLGELIEEAEYLTNYAEIDRTTNSLRNLGRRASDLEEAKKIISRIGTMGCGCQDYQNLKKAENWLKNVEAF